MEFETRQEGPVLVVSLGGKLDAVTAPDYEQRIRALIDQGQQRLVVDFERLDYISSAGLRALLVTAKLVAAKGGRAALANVRGNVQSVFEMSGFASIFTITDTVATALESVGGA